MSKFISNLNLVLKGLELGIEIKFKDGGKLLWSEEHEAPGYWHQKYDQVALGDGYSEGIMKVDHADTWMSLLAYVRGMTEEAGYALSSKMVLAQLKRNDIRKRVQQ